MQRESLEYEVTWLIRRSFRAMAAAADRFLTEFRVSAAERAVMEFLHPDLLLTVPEIAQRYDVSRQHIQNTANSLLDKGLLRSSPNPKHKRSALLKLSDSGRQTFGRIRRDERQRIGHWFDAISDSELALTHAALQQLLQHIEKE